MSIVDKRFSLMTREYMKAQYYLTVMDVATEVKINSMLGFKMPKIVKAKESVTSRNTPNI